MRILSFIKRLFSHKVATAPSPPPVVNDPPKPILHYCNKCGLYKKHMHLRRGGLQAYCDECYLSFRGVSDWKEWTSVIQDLPKGEI